MKCLTYYAQEDQAGFPIPGTMQAHKSPCACNWIEMPTEEMVVDPGYMQVFHPNKLRFFVRLDCGGKVVPNSLFSSLQHPGGTVIEYKRIISE